MYHSYSPQVPQPAIPFQDMVQMSETREKLEAEHRPSLLRKAYEELLPKVKNSIKYDNSKILEFIENDLWLNGNPENTYNDENTKNYNEAMNAVHKELEGLFYNFIKEKYNDEGLKLFKELSYKSDNSSRDELVAYLSKIYNVTSDSVLNELEKYEAKNAKSEKVSP